MMKKLDLDAWKRHLLNGHIPYNRECKSCVVAASRGRAHRRIPHADAYTLSIDAAGPFELAEDQLRKGRHLLVGVYLAPATKEGQSIIPINEDDELAGAMGDGPELTVVEDGDAQEEKKWPGLDDEKAWAERVGQEHDFQVKQVLMVEILENRRGPAVVEAVGRMAAKLTFLGFPLLRLHSDRAGEFQSKKFDRWCRRRGLWRTFTDGDNFRGNGRVEGAIAQVKRGARTLLLEAGLDESHWCHASRHWAECRLRRQLESMGWKRRELAPFGQVVWAKRKLYSDRRKYLSTTRTQVRVLCPAVTMSLTTSGYLVQEISTGKLFHTGDIIHVKGAPEELELPEREAGFLHEVDEREDSEPPEKRPRRSRKSLKLLHGPGEDAEAVDWGELHLRGARLLAEELNLLEEDDGEVDNERFLKALTAEIEDEQLAAAEKALGNGQEFLQTRIVGLAEVRKNMSEWKPSMLEEYGALVTAKAIFSRKAGSGRHKCRGVACGNFAKAKSDEDTFASGAGGCEVRLLLKAAALYDWTVSTVDVKTAFLNAPVNESAERGIVIVEPPRIFREAQVLQQPGELWLVRKALYGLATSPKDWCLHRDRCFREFSWNEGGVDYKVVKTAQDDMWAVRGRRAGEAEWQMVGLCATYVDDILIAGNMAVVKGIHEKIRESWKIGEPSWIQEGGEPVRFLGMEIEKKGKNFILHQRAYLENLFLEYEESGQIKTRTRKAPRMPKMWPLCASGQRRDREEWQPLAGR